MAQLTVWLLALIGVAVVPLAGAQTPPSIETAIRWESRVYDNGRVVLMDASTLRENLDLEVGLRIVGDYFCSPGASYAARIDVDAFPTWAGASLEPNDRRTLTFEVPQGNGGLEEYQWQIGPSLDIAWSDDHPHDAAWTYRVAVREVWATGQGGCTPQPDPNTATHHDEHVTVRIGTPASEPEATEDPCETDPYASACSGATLTGDAMPGPGAFASLLVALAAALARAGRTRRRRRQS